MHTSHCTLHNAYCPFLCPDSSALTLRPIPRPPFSAHLLALRAAGMGSDNDRHHLHKLHNDLLSKVNELELATCEDSQAQPQHPSQALSPHPVQISHPSPQPLPPSIPQLRHTSPQHLVPSIPQLSMSRLSNAGGLVQDRARAAQPSKLAERKR